MLILSSAYLAPVEYYVRLNRSQIIIDPYEHYTKQTYRNRCHIATANGVAALSIPVEKCPSGKCLVKDIRISEHGNWRHSHWNAIVSAYNSTPFFEYYEDDFRPFFEKPFPFLFDFNEQLRELLCTLLDLSPAVSYSSAYIEDTTGLTDCRDAIHPKKTPAENLSKPYYQVFDQKFGFQPNLSIIDLLFNRGPESILYLS